MEEKLRKTGIDVISGAPWGTHICQFYQTKKDLIDILVPYFKAGLENNEFCIWITSEPLKVEDAKAALKKVVKNLDHFVKKGQIEILDYSEWYTKSGKFDANNVLQGWVEKEKQALKRGYDGLRVSGNTFWLGKRDWKNFADYEEKVNNLIGKYRMISICVYSLSKCGASEAIDVVSNHQFALIRRKGKWVIMESSERKRTEDQLRNSEKQLRALAARLQSVREEERAMIAREIHDELGQVLTGLKIDLFWLSKKLPEDQKSLLGKTKSMLELIDTTIQSVRKLSTELRPGVLDNLGLKAAIEWQIGEFQTRTGIRCEFIAPKEDIALDQDCSTAVFRIFQETLTNVVRHSKATRVNITLEKSADHLLLEVQDNGKGIQESKIVDLKSLGLLGMRERALYFGGKVKFEGIQGKGTKVTVLIPLNGKKENGSEGL
jgi:signal transduction histidine kinase